MSDVLGNALVKKPESRKFAIYIRHGETHSNKLVHGKTLSDDDEKKIKQECNPDLTDIGLEQGVVTADYLTNAIKESGFSKIILLVSEYDRAKKTAEPFINKLETLAKHDGISFSIKYDTEIIEYTPIHKVIPDELQRRGITHDPTISDFIQRVTRFNNNLKEQLQAIDSSTVVIIYGHSLFFSVLLTHQGTQELFSKIKWVAHELPNCSVSTVSYKPQSNIWSIHNTGSTSHLPSALTTGSHTLFGR